ncbi:MAG: hypothetical protein A2Y13_05430 [Planctomycetes bacterium GWC2_45_44]|nr:MAG: hypothetical protein A2Y13_05430 [Planctomycetes bacterium GWC2_45_44]
MKIKLSLLLVLLFAGFASATVGDSWNLYNDYVSGTNPNGAWEYTSLEAGNPGYEDGPFGYKGGPGWWWDQSYTQCMMHVGAYNGGYGLDMAAGEVGINSNAAWHTVLQWTAPQAGTYKIDATFIGSVDTSVISQTPTPVYIQKNLVGANTGTPGDALYYGTVTDTTTPLAPDSIIVTLDAGDTISFACGGINHEGYSELLRSDWVALTANIEQVPDQFTWNLVDDYAVVNPNGEWKYTSYEPSGWEGSFSYKGGPGWWWHSVYSQCLMHVGEYSGGYGLDMADGEIAINSNPAWYTAIKWTAPFTGNFEISGSYVGSVDTALISQAPVNVYVVKNMVNCVFNTSDPNVTLFNGTVVDTVTPLAYTRSVHLTEGESISFTCNGYTHEGYSDLIRNDWVALTANIIGTPDPNCGYVTVPSCEDTCVFTGTSISDKGSDSNIPVGSFQYSTGSFAQTESYFKFHVPDFIEAPAGKQIRITSARVAFWTKTKSSPFVGFDSGLFALGNQWSENTLSGNNHPAMGALETMKWSYPGDSTRFVVDILGYAQSVASSGQEYLSVGLKALSSQPNGNLYRVFTREDSLHAPRLILSYTYVDKIESEWIEIQGIEDTGSYPGSTTYWDTERAIFIGTCDAVWPGENVVQGEMYMKFYLPQLIVPAGKDIFIHYAVLRTQVVGCGAPIGLTFHKLDDFWVSSQVTGSNHPIPGAQIGDPEFYPGNYQGIWHNVTEYARSAVIAYETGNDPNRLDGYLSFAVKPNPTGLSDPWWLRIFTMEETAAGPGPGIGGGPALLLNYSYSPLSPNISGGNGVNFDDFAALAFNWQKCSDPTGIGCELAWTEASLWLNTDECGYWGFFNGDLNLDCYVDFDDLKFIVDSWLLE